MSAKKPYDVGYKKPPKNGQFQPGQSGNPKGRPRKAPTEEPVPLDIRAILGAPAEVVEDGRTVHMPPKLVEPKRQLLAASKGDPKAALWLARQFVKYEAIGASDAHQAVVVLPSSTMPWEMALTIAEEAGPGPWSRKQMEKGRNRYKAERTEQQKRIDDAIGYDAL